MQVDGNCCPSCSSTGEGAGIFNFKSIFRRFSSGNLYLLRTLSFPKMICYNLLRTRLIRLSDRFCACLDLFSCRVFMRPGYRFYQEGQMPRGVFQLSWRCCRKCANSKKSLLPADISSQSRSEHTRPPVWKTPSTTNESSHISYFYFHLHWVRTECNLYSCSFWTDGRSSRWPTILDQGFANTNCSSRSPDIYRPGICQLKSLSPKPKSNKLWSLKFGNITFFGVPQLDLPVMTYGHQNVLHFKLFQKNSGSRKVLWNLNRGAFDIVFFLLALFVVVLKK